MKPNNKPVLNGQVLVFCMDTIQYNTQKRRLQKSIDKSQKKWCNLLFELSPVLVK